MNLSLLINQEHPLLLALLAACVIGYLLTVSNSDSSTHNPQLTIAVPVKRSHESLLILDEYQMN